MRGAILLGGVMAIQSNKDESVSIEQSNRDHP